MLLFCNNTQHKKKLLILYLMQIKFLNYPQLKNHLYLLIQSYPMLTIFLKSNPRIKKKKHHLTQTNLNEHMILMIFCISSYWNFDTLTCKHSPQLTAINNTWKLFGTVNFERFTKLMNHLISFQVNK